MGRCTAHAPGRKIVVGILEIIVKGVITMTAVFVFFIGFAIIIWGLVSIFN